MKILVLRFSSMGDIVLTTPVVRCLKKTYPHVAIHYATKQSFISLLSGNPYIDKIHALKNSHEELIAELRAENFDFTIDLHHNQRTALIKVQTGVRSFSFPKLNFQKWLLVNTKLNFLPDKHIVDRYLEASKSLQVVNDGMGLDFFIEKNARKVLNKLPFHGQSYLAFVIGAKHFTKRLPPEMVAETIDRLNMPAVLLGGKEDEDTARTIMSLTKKSDEDVLDFCGKLSVHESAAILDASVAVLTNDTGLMHIAAALKKPIASIWGSTVPAFGMTPYYGSTQVPSVIIQNQNLTCRPCTKIGLEKCPLNHFKCMKSLSPSEIATAVQNLAVNSL